MVSDIVIVGSCNVDFVSYVSRLPRSGETVNGSKVATNFGGKGANQCVAAAKLGGHTTLIARVGDDVWGKNYIEHLKTLNANVDYIKEIENMSSGIAQINVSDSENQIVVVAGANGMLNVQDIEDVQSIISDATVVLSELGISVDVAIRTLQLCTGISILNAAPALTEYDPRLLSLPTIFCVNESEAATFTGLPVDNKREAESAAIELLSKGCISVIITLGPLGALYVNREDGKCIHVDSPSVKCVDSTGAGDAFIGALAYLLANKTELGIEKSIEVACIAAAESVTHPGTHMSYPGPEVLDR